jgi:hypothetical protein
MLLHAEWVKSGASKRLIKRVVNFRLADASHSVETINIFYVFKNLRSKNGNKD